MSFEDDLREMIRTAREETDREEQEARTFANTWEARKTTDLWRLLKAAEAILKEERVGARVHLTNGSILLEATGKSQHKLKFSPNDESLVIVCSSTIPDSPEESFTLDALTEETIQTKVKQFIYEVLRGKKRKGSGLLVA